MAIFKWLERKLFTGAVIKDYGVIAEKKAGLGTMRQTLLLCRRKNALEFVIRSSAKAPFGASVNYVQLPVTTELLETFHIALDDVAEARAKTPKA